MGELKSGDIEASLKFKAGSVEGSPAVNLWLHLEGDGGRKYLSDEQIAAKHLSLTSPGKVTKNSGYTFSTKFWSGQGLANYAEITESNPYRNLIFEGSGEGKGELVIEFKKGGVTLGEGGSCWVHLLNVRNMYERVKITPDDPDAFDDPYGWGGKSGEIYASPPRPAMSWVKDEEGNDFISDPLEEKDYIVFVHGWRMTYEGSQKYGETMFKRLWHSGYKGRFAFVRWPTYSAQTNPITGGLFTYNDSDYRAWISQFIP